MFLLFSGEGSTDLGACGNRQSYAEGEDFEPGPMAVLADKIVEAELGYSVLETKAGYGYLSKTGLEDFARKGRQPGRVTRLPRSDAQRETGYYFFNARTLAQFASTLADEKGDIIAILFRDGDHSQKVGREDWVIKRQSMLDGFATVSGFTGGVPMIPRPKSEAWLLCPQQPQPYQNCAELEERSGNDASPHSLKASLDEALAGLTDSEALCDLARTIDPVRIGMPSFQIFRERLIESVRVGPA